MRLNLEVVISASVSAILTTSTLITYLVLSRRKMSITSPSVSSQKFEYALRRYIIASSDGQTLSGLCLLISAYLTLIKDADQGTTIDNYQNMYFTLVVYVCCISSSSHLASLLAMKETRGSSEVQIDQNVAMGMLAFRIRVGLVLIFSALLIITINMNEYAFEPLFVAWEIVVMKLLHIPANVNEVLEYILPILVFVPLCFISCYLLFQDRKVLTAEERKGRLYGHRGLRKAVEFSKILWIRLTSFPRELVIGTQIIFSLISVTFLLLQKFWPAPETTPEERERGIYQWCSLNTPTNNLWGFGQSSVMLLLLIPIYVSLESYYGMCHKCTRTHY